MARSVFLRVLILAMMAMAPSTAWAQGELDDGSVGDIDLPTPGAPGLFDWPKGQISKDFWKSDPTWEKKGVSEWEKGKGWTKKDAEPSKTTPEVVLYGDSVKADDNVWGIGDDKNNLKVLGYDGIAGYTVGYKDGLKVSGTAIGKAYLIRGKLEGTAQLLGDEETGVSITGKVDARVGVEGVAGASVVATKEKVAVSGSLQAFAGAKAFGQVPLTATLCKLAATGRVKGEVSAGIGGTASGVLEIDWSSLKVKISGSLAATLGLGAGVGGDIYVDLSELVDDPMAVINCLKGKAKHLALKALAAGGQLVDAAIDVAEAGVDLAVDGAKALNRGARRAASAVGNKASSIASGIYNWFAGDDSSANPCP
jgi:hypothetical protein